MDHHHADVKTASKVRFAEPGSEPLPDDAPSPPLAENDEKDKDDKVIVNNIVICGTLTVISPTITKYVIEFLIILIWILSIISQDIYV